MQNQFTNRKAELEADMEAEALPEALTFCSPPLNLLQEESRKPPSTKFSEKALITNVTQGKLSNKKFSIPKIHKKHLKSVTQL